MGWVQKLTNLLSLVHCQTSNSQTCYSTESAVLHSLVITRLRWWWLMLLLLPILGLLSISRLLVSRLLLTIRLRLVVAPSTSIATLLRIAASVAALWLVSRVRVFEGTLAGLRVDEGIAVVSLVPLRIPWRG
jgi:hypothetical protein